MQEPPSSKLVNAALDLTDGAEFEVFAQSFLAAVVGARFVPMGGWHDGGADGLFRETIYEHTDRADVFMQASIDQRPNSKIKDTIDRLRDFGRSPRQLVYVTNQPIQNLDVTEEDLSTKLEVVIRIYERKYITTHTSVNSSAAVAYYQHLHHRTDYLRKANRTALGRSDHVSEPYVYTYLVGELDRDSGRSFADGVVDALIVFALEGTDPHLDIKMDEPAILTKILEQVPSAEAIVRERLRNRLEALSAKPDRRIRWHQQEDMWVLPYHERRILEQNKAEDRLLHFRAQEDLYDIFSAMDLSQGQTPEHLTAITLEVLQRTFEEDGLRFSQFISDPSPDDIVPHISDVVKSVLDLNGLIGQDRIDTGIAISDVLRTVFYNSTPALRNWLIRTSRAYAILFTLKGEPRILNYFDMLLTDTYLYVGTDILITALSERFVQPEDQHTRNLLRAASKAGTTLVLIAPVLEEVRGHLQISDKEYRDFVAPMGESYFEIAYHAPRILIRAFLYAQVLPVQYRPRSWESFIGQFCDYSDLNRPSGLTQLRRYLMSEFGMHFESWDHVKSVSHAQRHRRLTESISKLKRSSWLAHNDAYVYEMVTDRRAAGDEIPNALEYGYQTWWLSAGEGAAVKNMARVDKGEAQLLMRPSFLAKFIQLAPSTAEAREAMRDFLPSRSGIRIARRVSDDSYYQLMGTIEEAETLEDSRRAAKIGDLVDKLRNARKKEFDNMFTMGGREFVPLGDG